MLRDPMILLTVVFLMGLLMLLMLGSILYLIGCISLGARDYMEYSRCRTQFRIWQQEQKQRKAESLETRRESCLKELEKIQKQMARERKRDRRPVMQVYTFTEPAWKQEHFF